RHRRDDQVGGFGGSGGRPRPPPLPLGDGGPSGGGFGGRGGPGGGAPPGGAPRLAASAAGAIASACRSSCWSMGALLAEASAAVAAWSAMRRRVAVSVIAGRAAAACWRSNSATG